MLSVITNPKFTNQPCWLILFLFLKILIYVHLLFPKNVRECNFFHLLEVLQSRFRRKFCYFKILNAFRDHSNCGWDTCLCTYFNIGNRIAYLPETCSKGKYEEDYKDCIYTDIHFYSVFVKLNYMSYL